MADAIVQNFHRGLDAYNRRDFEAWLDVIDPEIEAIPLRDWPEAAPVQGAEAVWRFMVEGFSEWELTRIEIVGEVEEHGDKLLAETRAAVRGRASGAELDWDLWQLITHRDGKAVRSEWFASRQEALASAGIDGGER